jgi:porin
MAICNRRQRAGGRASAMVLAILLPLPALLAAGHAQAQDVPLPGGPAEQQSPVPGPSGAETPPAPAGGAAEPGFFTGLLAPSRNNLLNDMGGLRTVLGTYGISLGLQETSEVLGNVSGGVHRGADYDGLTEMSLGLDTQKAFGWEGGIFNISALQIHGRDLSTDNLDTLQTASGIEADRATRLWEVWYQQSFLSGALDVKLGQQSIDQEFMVSQYSGLFINTMMGWPALPSYDMYAGGPAYPLSSVGVRLRAQPTPALTVLSGVFDDNPPGGPFNNDSQLRGAEAAGAAFNLNTGALWITEVQYAINQPANGDMVSSNAPPSGLPGTYKVGFWYDSGAFPDQRFDTEGLSLANPASNGIPRMHQGNYSIYALADQMVWRPNPQSTQSLGVFARAMAAPPDRNLISFSADGGADLKAPFPGRDNDTFGLGFGVAKVSAAAGALDRDTALFTDSNYPERTVETFIEATYQYQVAPWWIIQPDAQYVIRPGAGIPDPVQPNREIGNELVFGLRTNVVF